jgi:hypothetical protein
MPGKNADYMMALTATNDAAGAAITLMAAGAPGSLSNVVVFQAMRDNFFRMFMEHSLQDRPSLARTQGAYFAYQGVRDSEEQLDKFRGASAELLDELHKIETIYDRRKLTTVNELPLTPQALPASTSKPETADKE